MKRKKFTKIINDTIKLPEKSGNGILKMLVSVDEEGQLGRYSLTYVNHRICAEDNGRVLGYDNSHGYHHRHYMGQEEPIKFTSYRGSAPILVKKGQISSLTKSYSICNSSRPPTV